MTGVGANTGELASAANSIKGFSQTIGDLKNGVQDSKLGKNDFGREHTGSADPYFEGLKKIAKAVEKNAEVTERFSGNLNDAARGYEWDDSNNAERVKNAGGR